MISWYTFFIADTKIKEHVSFESSEEKETFACTICGKICYVAFMINRAGQLICLLPAFTSPIVRVSLTRLSHLKATFNKTIIVFIIRATVHSTSSGSSISHWRTTVRSIIKYSKVSLSLSSRLFYELLWRYIANQSGSAKETVNPKIGEKLRC